MEYEEQHKLKLKKLNLEKEQSFYKILCPSCKNEVKSNDLNINDKIAKCGACNVVFSFQEMVNNLFTNPTKIKQEIIRPEGIDLFYLKDELDITVQQLYPHGLAILAGLMSMLTTLFIFLIFLARMVME